MSVRMTIGGRLPPWQPMLSEADVRGFAATAVNENMEMIARGFRYTGARQKKNAPSTTRRKVREGRPALSVVDKIRRFVKGSTYSRTVTQPAPGRWRVEIAVAAPADKEILEYITDLGYTRVLGLTAVAAGIIKGKLLAKAQRYFSRSAARRAIQVALR